MAAVLALDVGGTKLAAAVVDDSGRILGRGRALAHRRRPRAAVRGPAGLRGRGAARRRRPPRRLDGVGVAAPGPMVWPSGEVSPLNMPAWRGSSLRKRLAEEFASDRVLIHNDAVGLTVGEH